jgi:serine/threonine protein kinase
MSDDIQIPGYEILDELGAGGMAKVYLGVQTALDRKVAIKVLHSALSLQSDEFKQRFFHEGKVLARVNHPNIVSIYDIGEANDLLYMTMEYVPGGDLTDRIKREQLSVDECIQVCAQVGLALHTTHLEHIVHRDLKPSNVLMRDGVFPMLTDFGIARETDTDVGLTQTGHIVGTLQYMSPEQIRGLTVDHRSDIYSLGLLFYRLLIGKLPFVASSHYDLSRMQCEEPPPPLPPALSEFQGIMDTILAKDPNDRFQTTLEFCKALQSLEVTDEEFKTELTQKTQIYDPSRMPFQSYGAPRYGGSQSGSHSGSHSGSRSGEFSGRSSQSGEQYVSRDSDRYVSRDSDRYTSQPTGYQTGPGTAQQPPPAQKKGHLKAILGIGLPVLALVVAGIIFLWSQDRTGGATPDQVRRVEMYLKQLDRVDDQSSQEALDIFYRAQEIAPEYGPVRDKAVDIATEFEFKAEDLMAEQKYAEAQSMIEQGLIIDPGNEMLMADQVTLNDLLAEQQRQADIEEALNLARNYQAQDRLIEPPGANAYEQFGRVRQLDEANQAAQQGLAEIASALLADVQGYIADNNLSGAESMLLKIDARYPGNRDAARLRGQIQDQLRLAAELAEVEGLLADAARQISENKLINPEGDNALASYSAVLTIQSDNQVAEAGLQQLAAIFTEQAEAAIGASNFPAAVELADSGLLAMPDNMTLSNIREQALSQLGARDRMIQDLLQAAQNLVMSGDFVAPGDNAYDKFQEVLIEDPGNAQAQRGLSVLPRNILDEIDQMKLREYYSDGEALAQAAQAVYPNDSRFEAARAELGQLVAQEQSAQLLQQKLAESAALIARRPMTLDLIDQSAAALEAIRSEYPGDVTASTQLNALINAIAEEASNVSVGGSEDLGIDVLDQGLRHFAGNPQLLSARGLLVQQLEQRLAAAEEERRLNTGQLAIDALPSGTVTGIVDSAGQPVPLPDNPVTPLVLPLLKGDYTITIGGDNGGQPQTMTVTVVAQAVERTTARFDTIDADQYFERSGWASE